MTDRAVILVSGGMDSATVVYEAMDRGYDPYFLHTSYGQRTEHKEQQCAEALAERIASSLRSHLESYRLEADGATDTVPEFVQRLAEALSWGNETSILDELEAQMTKGIRSRLQYNLKSLGEKQYIRRSRGDDSRRAQIAISETGRQWVHTHDLPTVCREPMETILANEIDKFIDS